MFQLDDNFLEEVGLAQLPDDQRKAFLEYIYSQLELRVGTRLSEGLTDAQLSEFESFVDRDDERVLAWVNAYTPAYATDASYRQLHEKAPKDTDPGVILAEYASLKWLGINRPDYKQVVAEVLEELKREILGSRDAILAA